MGICHCHIVKHRVCTCWYSIMRWRYLHFYFWAFIAGILSVSIVIFTQMLRQLLNNKMWWWQPPKVKRPRLLEVKKKGRWLDIIVIDWTSENQCEWSTFGIILSCLWEFMLLNFHDQWMDATSTSWHVFVIPFSKWLACLRKKLICESCILCLLLSNFIICSGLLPYTMVCYIFQLFHAIFSFKVHIDVIFLSVHKKFPNICIIYCVYPNVLYQYILLLIKFRRSHIILPFILLCAWKRWIFL